jgi:hypothetical protein
VVTEKALLHGPQEGPSFVLLDGNVFPSRSPSSHPLLKMFPIASHLEMGRLKMLQENRGLMSERFRNFIESFCEYCCGRVRKRKIQKFLLNSFATLVVGGFNVDPILSFKNV